MRKPIPYPHGNSHLGIHPVHSFFGFKVRMNIWEIHHGYIGIVLVAIGTYLLTIPNYFTVLAGEVSFLLGLYLIYDDFLIQHPMQVYDYDPLYHSPVHVFIYDTLELYNNKYYRALNIFADWLFGSPEGVLLLAISVILLGWKLITL
jgi:hypothetical protein